VFLFFLQHSGSSQDPAVVTWQASGKKIADGQYEIKLTGTIKAGWHVYLKTKAAASIEDIKVSFSDSAVQETGTRQVSGNISSIDDVIFDAKAEIATGNIQIIQQISLAGKVPAILKTTIFYYTASTDAFIPEEIKIGIEMEGGVDMSAANRILIPTIDLRNPVNACGGTGISVEESSSKGLLTIFLLGFLGGLVALITPCVFPMIPLTVSFFTKKQ
jgi:thiol:disulfide interchange protein DsbD